MQHYKNINGNSGIDSYEIGVDFIKVRFKTSSTVYIYSTSKIAKHHIEKMKHLADTGKGLGTYISTHPEVKQNYRLDE